MRIRSTEETYLGPTYVATAVRAIENTPMGCFLLAAGIIYLVVQVGDLTSNTKVPTNLTSHKKVFVGIYSCNLITF
jgi:hypothetical protein